VKVFVHEVLSGPPACGSVHPVSTQFARTRPCCRPVYYEPTSLLEIRAQLR
jgi:hypothetical protein